MKDTVLPLSIAFFAGDGAFVSATDMEPCPPTAESCPLYQADGPYTDAIEVVQGDLLARHRLGQPALGTTAPANLKARSLRPGPPPALRSSLFAPPIMADHAGPRGRIGQTGALQTGRGVRRGGSRGRGRGRSPSRRHGPGRARSPPSARTSRGLARPHAWSHGVLNGDAADVRQTPGGIGDRAEFVDIELRQHGPCVAVHVGGVATERGRSRAE